MQLVQDLYFTHPFWVWLAVAAILLAAELPTGTGWLLWPSASAGVLAILTLTGIELGWAADVALWATLTIAATLISRKFLPKRMGGGPAHDINDRAHDLVGKTGQTIDGLESGFGRVLVDGAEWEAVLEGGEPPAAGGRIKVVKVLDGARLSVKPV